MQYDKFIGIKCLIDDTATTSLWKHFTSLPETRHFSRLIYCLKLLMKRRDFLRFLRKLTKQNIKSISSICISIFQVFKNFKNIVVNVTICFLMLACGIIIIIIIIIIKQPNCFYNLQVPEKTLVLKSCFIIKN